MEQYAEVVLDLAGNAVQGASVQVLVGSVNGPLATIYDAGGTPQQNPIPTGQRGEFAFQAANGKYALRVLINGTPYATVGPLTFYDPSDDTGRVTVDSVNAAVASAIPTLLGSSDGATKVGHSTSTVADALSALHLADYAALRAYAGSRNAVYVTGYRASAKPSAMAGLFVRDVPDTTTADNGGTVIVAGSVRWKRQLAGFVDDQWFGAAGAGDDTVRVQKAVDVAAALKLPLRSSADMVVTTVLLPSTIEWELGNCVLKRKDGSNMPLLRNANTSFAAGVYGNEQITIRGGVLDFNGMNQGDVGTDGAWLVGVRFAGVKGLEFHGTVFKNSRRFNIFIANCTKIRAYGTEIINDPAIPSHNKDGYHINGNVSDFYADAITVRYSEDDAFALNADDIAFGGDLTVANISGPIDDIKVGLLRCTETRNGVRLLSATKRIRNVQIGSITGDVSVYALNMQDYGLGAGSWYQNIRIGSIDCLFAARPYPEATLAMVNVETPNHSTDAYSNIEIGAIHRYQNDVDGQDRPTVNYTARRSKLKIGEISEFNCKHRFGVQMTGAKAGAKFELGRFQRWNSRADAGIFGSVIRVASSTSVVDFVRIGEVQADRLQHIALLEGAQIGELAVDDMTPTDSNPIYLAGSTVQRLFWKSNRTPSYGLSSSRYFKDGASVVQFERPAPLAGATTDRPTNAAYGDSFYDVTIDKLLVFAGGWRDASGVLV